MLLALPACQFTCVWAVEHASPVCARCCIHELLLCGLLHNAVGLSQSQDGPAA